MTPSLWLALIAAVLLNLDRQAWGQLGLSRPLVSAALGGFLAGHPAIGLSLGLWTEMLWMNRPPLGGHIPPNGGLACSAALLGLALAASGPNLAAALPAATHLAPDHSAAIMAPVELFPDKPAIMASLAVLAFALTPPLAKVTTLIDVFSRRLSTAKIREFEAAVAMGAAPSALTAQMSSLMATLGLSIVFLAAASIAAGAMLYASLALAPSNFWSLASKCAILAPVASLAYMSDTVATRRQAVCALALAAFFELFRQGLIS